MTERIRITLDVTRPMKNAIDQLAEQMGTSHADVLRRAVALLYAVKEAELKGEGTAAIAKNGRVVTKLIGF